MQGSPRWPTASRPGQPAPAYAAPTGRADDAVTWLLAQPTTGQARAGDPLADPAFHLAMAARLSASSPGRAILLGERLARRRGSGGRTVASCWADAGVEVTVMADADPRQRSATRQLFVDGPVAVDQWARNVRGLGAAGACWYVDAESPTDQARVTAEIVGTVVTAGLAPMLWVSRPGSPVHGNDGLRRVGDLLGRAEAHGADLEQLTVCLRVDPSTRSRRSRLGALVAGLQACIPARVAQVLVVVPRDRLHLAQGDAYELGLAVSQQATPWPVTHCAGDLALRLVRGWWQVPDLAGRAGGRLETILDQLARPSGPVHVRGHEPAAEAAQLADPPSQRSARIFDTSLFRTRSLYRPSAPTQP